MITNLTLSPELVVFSNSDIGVMVDFYPRMYEWANTDFRLPKQQLIALRKSLGFVNACMNVKEDDPDTPAKEKKLLLSYDDHITQCSLDLERVYRNFGGLNELLPGAIVGEFGWCVLVFSWYQFKIVICPT